ncbi:MAG: hypothetical protein AB8H80_10365 [Planctomycetota bacterium]
MHFHSARRVALLAAASALALTSAPNPLLAQGQRSNGARSDRSPLAAPVQLTAGDQLLGKGRLYPSPVAHDWNGDGLFDIFVGDLFGHITVAVQQANDGSMIRFDAEQKLKDQNGKVLDFGNW